MPRRYNSLGPQPIGSMREWQDTLRLLAVEGRLKNSRRARVVRRFSPTASSAGILAAVGGAAYQ